MTQIMKRQWTSVATPGVTGSMLLIQEYYEQMEGSLCGPPLLKRNWFLHSADDVMLLAVYKMVWGVINSKSAVEHIGQQRIFSHDSEEKQLWKVN